MTKYCPHCKTVKDVEEFWFKNKAKGQRAVYCIECFKKRKNSQQVRDYHRKLKDAVIAGYGGKCACCGESERGFLTLDHVNGGGCEHRRKSGFFAPYRDALRRNFPPDYQALCYNCNCAKAFLGCCPHKADNAAGVNWRDQKPLRPLGRPPLTAALQNSATIM